MTSTVEESWSLNYVWVRSQTHVSTRVLIEPSHYLAVTSIISLKRMLLRNIKSKMQQHVTIYTYTMLPTYHMIQCYLKHSDLLLQFVVM